MPPGGGVVDESAGDQRLNKCCSSAPLNACLTAECMQWTSQRLEDEETNVCT